MGEVKRYDMLIDYGCSKFDSPEIDPHEIKDGYWVMHSDYATLEAERAASEAACAAKDGALGICQDMLTFVNESSKQYKSSVVVALRTVAAALSPDAGRNWIDATGAVEAEASKCNDCTCVLVPAEWAGSTVKIVRVP